jgi:hypothetical protein
MRQLIARLGASWAVVALAVALVPAAAHADGDPASDVLVTQPAFIPWYAGVSTARAAQLSSLLQTASREGFPVRVALIASASDLGSVTALWKRPVAYAEFLGQELSLVYPGRVLVLMPDGVGLSENGRTLALPSAVASAGLRGSLAERAGNLVRGLAAAAGHHLATQPVVAPRRARAAAQTPAGALGFVVGVILIALAWAASLHARPPEGRLGRLFTPDGS